MAIAASRWQADQCPRATKPRIGGLAALIQITDSEPANDTLTINALAGNDVVEASGLTADAIRLVAGGGIDDDVLVGSAGDDTLLGGDGDDVLVGGPGIDMLDGGPGDNVVIQGWRRMAPRGPSQ